MNKLVACGLVATTVFWAASCGSNVEFAPTEGNGGEGGASLSGSNSTGTAGGSTGSSTSTSGGMTSSSSGGVTSSSSSGGVICPSFGDLCTECLAIQCADVYCSCHGNFDCFSLSNCLNDCNGDTMCTQQCYASNPQGAAVLYALSNCGGVNCPVECPGTQPLDPCTTCSVETCTDEFNACLASTLCLDLYTCLSGCGAVDLACNQQCYASFGGGVTLLQELLTCNKNNCSDC